MCITDNVHPHFFFDHTNPSQLYYSPDIDTGILALKTPAVGDMFNATIRVHNEGSIGGDAEVTLCVCPPGTGITTILNVSPPPPIVSVKGVPPCDPQQLLSTTAILPWTVPNMSHFCLCAMVRDAVLGPSPDGSYPSVVSGNQLSPKFDPNNARSAQCNVQLVQGGGHPKLARLKAESLFTDFAFAVVNPLATDIVSQVVAYPIAPHDSRIIDVLSKQSQIASALKLGQFKAGHQGELAVGRERILTPEPPHGIGPRRHDEASTPGHAPPPLLGHYGPLTPDVYSKLAVTSLRPEQTMNLVANETRQAIVHICAPEGAAPGDLFGVDIRHEILRRTSSQSSRLLGGLVVILRVPHPGDPTPGTPKGRPV